eukprot:PhM_4_TR14396/c0_g1_i1/m.10205
MQQHLSPDVWSCVLVYSSPRDVLPLLLASRPTYTSVSSVLAERKHVWDVWGLEKVQSLKSFSNSMTAIKTWAPLASQQNNTDDVRATYTAATQLARGVHMVVEADNSWVSDARVATKAKVMRRLHIRTIPNNRTLSRGHSLAPVWAVCCLLSFEHAVLLLIQSNAVDINAQVDPEDAWSARLLELAAGCGLAMVVRELLSRGVMLTPLEGRNNSLHICRTVEVLDLLAPHYPPDAIDSYSEWGRFTPLFHSLSPEVLRALCDKYHCNKLHRDVHGWTAANSLYAEYEEELFETALSCRVPFEPNLIARDPCEVEHAEGTECTCPLDSYYLIHQCVGNTHMLRRLVEEFGADVTVRNTHDERAVHTALYELFDARECFESRVSQLESSFEFLRNVTPTASLPRVASRRLAQYALRSPDDLRLALEVGLDPHLVLAHCITNANPNCTDLIVVHGADLFRTVVHQKTSTTPFRLALKHCSENPGLIRCIFDPSRASSIPKPQWREALTELAKGSSVSESVIAAVVCALGEVLDDDAELRALLETATSTAMPVVHTIARCPNPAVGTQLLEALCDPNGKCRLDINVVDVENRTALHSVRSEQTVTSLVRLGMRFSTFDPARDPHHFVRSGGIPLLRTVLQLWPDADAGLDPNALNASRRSLLHIAVKGAAASRTLSPSSALMFISFLEERGLDLAAIEAATSEPVLHSYLSGSDYLTNDHCRVVLKLCVDLRGDCWTPLPLSGKPPLHDIVTKLKETNKKGGGPGDSVSYAVHLSTIGTEAISAVAQLSANRHLSTKEVIPDAFVDALLLTSDVKLLHRIFLAEDQEGQFVERNFTYSSTNTFPTLLQNNDLLNHFCSHGTLRRSMISFLCKAPVFARVLVSTLHPLILFRFVEHRERAWVEYLCVAHPNLVLSVRHPTMLVSLLTHSFTAQRCRSRSSRVFHTVRSVLLDCVVAKHKDKDSCLDFVRTMKMCGDSLHVPEDEISEAIARAQSVLLLTG